MHQGLLNDAMAETALRVDRLPSNLQMSLPCNNPASSTWAHQPIFFEATWTS